MMQATGNFEIERDFKIKPEDISGIFPVLEKTSGGTVLLESQTPDGNSILVWNPVATIAVYSDFVDIQNHGGVDLPNLPLRPSQVPKFLQEVLDRYNVPNNKPGYEAFPFAGGFVGYVGYEWAARQESTAQDYK